jgi:hypothetical protein
MGYKIRETYERNIKSYSSAKSLDDLLGARGAEASREGAGKGLTLASSSLCPLGLDSTVAIKYSLILMRRLERSASSSRASSPEASLSSIMSGSSSVSSEASSSSGAAPLSGVEG